MKNRNIFVSIFFLAMAILSGCTHQSDKIATSYEVRELKVNLELTEPSYHELFDSCRIIKLESEPQSLLAGIDKAQCVNDSILLFDMRRSVVCLFAPDGQFLNRIGERGDGPEDYIMCYDFAVNPASDNVSLLSPIGELITYTLGNRFIGKEELPKKPNYFACEWLGKDYIALWSEVDTEECGISVANVGTTKCIYEDWHNDRILDMSRLKPLYLYNNNVFFAAPLTNDVYQVTDSLMRLSYRWNFGKDNIPDKYIAELLTIENPSERNDRMISDLESEELKYVPSFNGESDLYYCVILSSGIGEEAKRTSVFYNKKENTSMVFNKFKEGISFDPIFMTDKFVLSRIPYNEVDLYNQLFNTSFECEEDDNPLLVKFYF